MGKNILTRELLLKSVEEWNRIREENPDLKPDLRGADLREADLRGVDLMGANLSGAIIMNADLSGAYLSGANLSQADLSETYLIKADLNKTNLNRAFLVGAEFIMADIREADMSGANLIDANFNKANLTKANLRDARLSRAIFIEANLSQADLSKADLDRTYFSEAYLSGAVLSGTTLRGTTFSAVDLSSVTGLESVFHQGPSTIGIDTLFASHGNIPEIFLRGCGVPDIFIEYVHSLTAKPFDYYSCFISHSTSDKVFADRLHADLQAKGVRCWYAPHDMEGGEHVDTQIDRAIKVHEKLLLVLSERSINSNWVKREIGKAVKREEAEGKRVLFPISLVEFSTLEEWEFVDSKGRDLSEEIRKFYIPSFKGWENDNSLYTAEFDKLLKAFKDKSKQ